MIPVMLVEDEFLVRVGLKTCIAWEELGYQIVAEADSAEAAMLKYAQHVPQLILTDIRLPHKSRQKHRLRMNWKTSSSCLTRQTEWRKNPVKMRKS